MCGICGLFGQNDLSLLERMLNIIRYRGPDDYRLCHVGDHCMGTARLEIEGGAEASQPLVDDETGTAIVFNGEIYNYKYLYDDLVNNGLKNFPRTEIQVIKNLYLHDGDTFPAKLRGMFAIAVLDTRKKRILLTRDPIGIKPLYYTIQGNKLAFASEIKSLLQIETLTPEFDIGVLEGLMTFGYVFQQDRTLFKNISQVKPGTTMTFDGHRISGSVYYEIPPAKYMDKNAGNTSFDETAAIIGQLFEDAIQIQMNHGDQKKAFYLSGGVDSTFMVSTASRISSYPITAYTLADGESSEDLQYARKVSKALNIEHREIPVDIEVYLEAVPDYIHHYEHVIAGGVFDIHGGIAFHILSKEISKEFKVAFSGEGADELFGGYYWTYSHPLGFSERIKKRSLKIGAKEDVRKVLDELFPQPEDALTYRKNLLDWLMKGGLSNYHLCSVDRSCGAFGFEIRPVYLDLMLMDKSLRLPIEFKLGEDGRQTKLILKEAARPLFEKLELGSILSRQKLGMPWAVRNLEPHIKSWIENRITQKHLLRHPYRRFLTGKIETCMFDLFYYIFIARRGILDKDFDIDEFFKKGEHEHLYT
jgi:asparagine synthase (glutamine-hydrolysing)